MRVSLFATCLVDGFFPEVGASALRLLRRLGCEVDFPPGQTCCGQPAWNAGHEADARRMAAATIRAFTDSEYVVAPSGSCAAMLRVVYPEMFRGDPDLDAPARALAARTYEFSEFLTEILKADLRLLGAHLSGTVAYHASCHMTRELGVREAPLQLLDQVAGLERRDLDRPDLCCGFGGTFSVKLPEVAEAMADDKLADLAGAGADCLVGADVACLMHLRGRLRRTGGGVQVRHIAEVLEQATRGAADKGGKR